MNSRTAQTRQRITQVAVATVFVSALHFLTPAGLHGWQWIHILLQKLYFVPILLAAATLGRRGTIAAASGASLLFFAHILLDWKGNLMVQAEQVGEIANFWIIGLTASFLFDRETRALEQTATAHEETLAALVSALDLREHNTALHSRRVKEYTVVLAERLGIAAESAVLNIGMGALLHDVGKIGVSDRILVKEGTLTGAERSEIRRHPDLGASLLGPIRFLEGAREIVRFHHEWFDGAGYPAGVSEEDIPIGARVFAVVDVFDALTTDRPYRSAMSYRDAVNLIVTGQGIAFRSDRGRGVPGRALWAVGRDRSPQRRGPERGLTAASVPESP